jgi:hypothetical protein
MNQMLYKNLYENLHAVNQIYKSATYGASYNEVKTLKILQKLGSRLASNQLSKEKICDVAKKLDAMESVKDQETVSFQVNNQELRAMRMVMRSSLKSIRRVPSLAREQAVISFTSYVEAYISDLLREIFDQNIDCLKSNKSTLKDEELIESLKAGSTLETLKEAKIKDLMYGSVKDWISYFQNRLGFQIVLSNDIIELYLVRNCLVHNGGKVSKQLENEIKTGRYKLGTKINVTERDYNRYESAVFEIANEIWKEYTKKFN